MSELTADDIRNLPLPNLGVKILAKVVGYPRINDLLGWMKRDGFPNEADLDLLMMKVADAWSWLEAHALLADDQRNPTGRLQRVSELGAALVNDATAISKVWAADRLSGDLDPSLSSARTNFALGDYETAAFAAMKAVEVEVRRVAGLPNDLLGVNLMRKAFSAKDGVLRDTKSEGGEQQATMDLFAGAIGLYKNPASHRTVEFEDPIEAVEVIQLADLLLRIVRRARDRRLTDAK